MYCTSTRPQQQQQQPQQQQQQPAPERSKNYMDTKDAKILYLTNCTTISIVQY